MNVGRLAPQTTERLSKMQTGMDNNQVLLAHIDAIIQELENLRCLIAQQSSAPAPPLVERLFGSLGQGTWDEYDVDIDWLRFGAK